VVARKTEETIEAVASAGTLITDSTVGTGAGLSVIGACLQGCPLHFALEVSLLIIRAEEGLTARLARGRRLVNQKLLLSSVVTVSELDINFWGGLGTHVKINLNLRNCKVRKGFEGILNRVRVLLCSERIHVNLDGAGIVLATELVSKTQLEERFLGTALERASQLLDVLTTIGITFGLRVVTFGTTTERAIIAFVTSITMALLVLEPRPVNTPSRCASSLRVSRNLCAIWYFGSLSNVVERVGVSAALSVPAAVVGASGSATPFTSEGRETFALASGTITQTTSATLTVNVLVVKGCVLLALQLLAIGSLYSVSRPLGDFMGGSRRSENPVFLNIGRSETHRVGTLELCAV
jgi:hypothetical protein